MSLDPVQTAALDRALAALKVLGSPMLDMEKRDIQRYSLFRAIRAKRHGVEGVPRIDAKLELDCSKAIYERLARAVDMPPVSEGTLFVPADVLTKALPVDIMARAMATTPGSKGGYLVSVENMGFIDILRNRSVVQNMGTRIVSGLEGNVTFPRQTGKATVTWQSGEHTSVTASDQTLGQLSMTPKTAICITDVSEQLLRQSSPSAEQFVMADLAGSVAEDLDRVAIKGAGGAEPLGIMNTTGITSGQDAGTASYAKVLAFPVAAGNAIRGNPGWVTNLAGSTILMQRQRFTGTDSPLWQGNQLDGELVGFRSMSSEHMANGELVFGSWDELVIGEWGVLMLDVDRGGSRFNAATVGIRAMWMVDVMIRYPQSFVVSTNLS